MANNLRLYVWTNLDGILVCPWTKLTPESQKRVFLGGSSIRTMNSDQLKALVALVFRDPDICNGKDAAVFYDGNDWNNKGCPDEKRGKKLLVLDLHE
jgi:hypothetical protein